MALLDDILFYWTNDLRSNTLDPYAEVKKVSSFKYFYTVMTSRGIQAMLCYRWANGMYKRGIPFLPKLLSKYSQLMLGIDISYKASLGKGILILHGYGVVIGRGVKTGDHIKIYNGVTLGVNDAYYKGLEYSQSYPELGSNILLGTGAKILGPVKVGSDAVIGANSVVTRDVENGAIVSGIPAKKIGSVYDYLSRKDDRGKAN